MTISIQQPLTRVFLVDGHGDKSNTILSSQLEREGFLLYSPIATSTEKD
jgi:hypothetical protein